MSANPASLEGKNIAILATDGFERSDLIEPLKALDQAGAKTVVIAPEPPERGGAPWNPERSSIEPVYQALTSVQ